MPTVVIKYVQLVCIAFLFDNISCDNLSLEASRGNIWVNRDASCIAHCMEINSTDLLSECYTGCQSKDRTENPKEIFGNETVRLVCRDSDSITIEVRNYTSHEYRVYDELYIKNKRKYSGRVYLVRVQENSREFPQKIVYLADAPIITIANLKLDTEYNISASIFTRNYEYWHVEETVQFRTFAMHNYQPTAILNETVTFHNVISGDATLPRAIIRWDALDKVCYYLFGLFDMSPANSMKADFRFSNEEELLMNPHQLYAYETNDLHLDTEYEVRIAGVNTKHNEIEGPTAILRFTTPKCYDFHGYNFTKCLPLEPENVTATTEFDESMSALTINVFWNKQSHPPDHYNVSLFFEKRSDLHQTVPGTMSNTSFDAVHIDVDKERKYEVIVTAVSASGSMQSQEYTVYLTSIFLDDNDMLTIHTTYICAILLMLIASLVYYIDKMNKRRKRNKVDREYVTAIVERCIDDPLEMNDSDVDIGEKIGSGAFGIVRKGKIISNNKQIAVKMIKPSASIVEIADFLSEIAIMKMIGHHKNIVQIIGHCTQNLKEIKLLTELCNGNNLLDFLKNYENCKSIGDLIERRPLHRSEFNVVSNRGYSAHSNPSETYNLKSFVSENVSLNALRKIQANNNNNNGSTYETNLSQLCGVANVYRDPPPESSDYQVADANCHLLIAENKGYGESYSKESQVENAYEDSILESCHCQLPSANDLFFEKQQINDQSPNIKPPQLNVSNEITILSSVINGMTKEFTFRHFLEIARQIAFGMEHLASKNIVHRDLATRNILIHYNENCLSIKIADFGLSRLMEPNAFYRQTRRGQVPLKWIALESLLKQEYTSQSDVWSFGILLYEIVMMGKPPYEGIKSYNQLVRFLKRERPVRPSNCSEQLYWLMRRCWNEDPNQRPTFTTLISEIHGFIYNPDFVAFYVEPKTSLTRFSPTLTF